jgi:two-component system, chemotaxis family, sensor kinase Cph1
MLIIELSAADQFIDFFSDIFSTKYWPARWHCGKWSDFHGWLYIISDLMIWAAYFAIPLLLFRLITKRSDLPFTRIFWLFIAFILLCGLTHLMDAVIFWWPAYRLSAVIRLVAGVVSLFTVVALYKILPFIFTLRTAQQLQDEVEQRKKAEEEARFQALELEKSREVIRVKDEFVNLASHELKTPLTSLRGYIQLLQMRAVNTDAQNREILTKAANQTIKLTNLINDLFYVSKMQMGLESLTQSKFNISEVIAECCEHFALENKDIVTKPLDDIYVQGDREKIKKVLFNLLENAFKYSPLNSRVILDVKKVNGRVNVSVEDFGPGVEKDKLPHLFERYYRVEHTSQNYSGMGLGLYICAQYIHMHGGTIGVESKPGKGSIFWFELPESGTANALKTESAEVSL